MGPFSVRLAPSTVSRQLDPRSRPLQVPTVATRFPAAVASWTLA